MNSYQDLHNYNTFWMEMVRLAFEVGRNTPFEEAKRLSEKQTAGSLPSPKPNTNPVEFLSTDQDAVAQLREAVRPNVMRQLMALGTGNG